MAGYHGYSMSNNAVQAYADGQRPLSRWTKADILDEVPDSMRTAASRLTVSELRILCLDCVAWHHTGSMYNRTDFYAFTADRLTPEAIADGVRGMGDLELWLYESDELPYLMMVWDMATDGWLYADTDSIGRMEDYDGLS